MTPQNDDDRILDLLTERLQGPLDKKRREELERLLAAHPEWHRYDLEFVGAAVHLALEPDLEEMPEALKARLIGAAVGEAARPGLRLAHDGEKTGARTTSGTATRSGSGTPVRSTAPRRPVTRALVVAAPWFAAAAAVVVAVVGWSRAPGAAPESVAVGEPGVVSLAWAQTADPLGLHVHGDVVWSDAKQAGVMRFRDLPANDPKKAQYQLWIFDAERDERYPVDGGVFDVAPNGETVVAIKARVPVGKATLFAVTLERPGGVVVSTRERLVALAKVG